MAFATANPQNYGGYLPNSNNSVPQNNLQGPYQQNLNPSVNKNKNSNKNEQSDTELEVFQEKGLKSLYHDFIKCLSKQLLGSGLTDLLKSALKDGKLTLEDSLEKTFIGTFLSRITTDLISSRAVRLFSGKTKIAGMRIPHLPPEISSQIFASISVFFCRALTSEHNVNKESSKGNMSERELVIHNYMKKTRLYSFINTLNKFFHDHMKHHFDFALKKIFGIKTSTKMKDDNGNTILAEIIQKDGSRTYEDMKTNPKVNYTQLGSIVGGSAILTALLPRYTKASGFDAVKSPTRGVISTLFTTICRLNSTLLTNGLSMHLKGGANFDKTFKTSLVEKSLVPLVQYTASAVGAVLSNKIPLNGAFLGELVRLVFEVPATFLASSQVKVAKKDRMSGEWKYIGDQLWKPTADNLEKILKPGFKILSKSLYSKFGMFPNIKDMYDVDIANKNKKQEAKQEQEIKNNNYPESLPGVFAMFANRTFKIGEDIVKLVNNCRTHTKERESRNANVQIAVNRRVRFEHENQISVQRLMSIPEEKIVDMELKEKAEAIIQDELSKQMKITRNEKGDFVYRRIGLSELQEQYPEIARKVEKESIEKKELEQQEVFEDKNN